MGKKYLPIIISGVTHKLFLDDLQKIHRNIKKTQKPIPLYPSSPSKNILRKATQETQPDCDCPEVDLEEDSFQI